MLQFKQWLEALTGAEIGNLADRMNHPSSATFGRTPPPQDPAQIDKRYQANSLFGRKKLFTTPLKMPNDQSSVEQPVNPGQRIGNGRIGNGRIGNGRIGNGRIGNGRIGNGRVV